MTVTSPGEDTRKSKPAQVASTGMKWCMRPLRKSLTVLHRLNSELPDDPEVPIFVGKWKESRLTWNLYLTERKAGKGFSELKVWGDSIHSQLALRQEPHSVVEKICWVCGHWEAEQGTVAEMSGWRTRHSSTGHTFLSIQTYPRAWCANPLGIS